MFHGAGGFSVVALAEIGDEAIPLKFRMPEEPRRRIDVEW